jgi:hypothetical protein
LAIGAPSPFYLIVMLVTLDGTTSPPDAWLVTVGAVSGILWGVVGLLLLAAASRRCARLVAQHDAAVAQAEQALRDEDAAMEAAKTAAS